MAVIDGDLRIHAISLYEQSQTARTTRGRRALHCIQRLPPECFLWSSFSPPPLFGSAPDILDYDQQAYYDGSRLVVNSGFRTHPHSVAMLSIQFAHEGVHIWYWNTDQPYVEHELQASRNEVEYYRELRSGTVQRRFHSNAAPLPPQEFQEALIRKINADTLVDHYVQRFHQDDSVVPITGAWVLGHIRYWGGIPRREINTKIAYIQALRRDWYDLPAEPRDSVFLELLESFERNPGLTEDTRDWIQRAFFFATPDQRRRLRELSDRWRVNLLADSYFDLIDPVIGPAN
jgi:hypothetical protein